MADFEGIERVLIVHSGQSQPPIDKDFQLDAYIFEKYFQKDELPLKKDGFFQLMWKKKFKNHPLKNRILNNHLLSFHFFHHLKEAEHQHITKIAWTEDIFPDPIQKLEAYKIHGIGEIKHIPVHITSKSPMIWSYMNQRTKIQKTDYQKMTELIASRSGRKVYTFNKIVGYYDIEKMVYHYY